MPVLQKGTIYAEPGALTRPAPLGGLGERTSEIVKFLMQMKMQEYLKQKEAQQELASALTLAKEKAKIMTPKEEAEAEYYKGFQKLLPSTTAEGTIVGQAPFGTEGEPQGMFTGGGGRISLKSLKGPMGETWEVEPTEAELKQKDIREEESLERKQVFVARKDLDKYTSDATQSLIALNKIGTEAKKLPTYQRGVFKQLINRTQAGLETFAKDKDITRYLGVVNQELIPIARKLAEEKGPITEFDVARIEKGLGDLTTPLEDKLFLLEQFREKVRKAIKNKMQVAEISEDEFANKYKELYNNLYKGQSELPSGVTEADIEYTMQLHNLSREEVLRQMGGQ